MKTWEATNTLPRTTRCAACGANEPPLIYHPYAMCVLVAHYKGDVRAARAALNAALDYGRQLERLGLPNDAPIPKVSAKPKRRGR